MKQWKLLLSLILSLFILNSSCSKDDDGTKGGGATDIKTDLKSTQVIEADNQFGLEIFKQVNTELEEGKNLMISPMSISLALAMAYNGADGATKTQMEEMLHKAGMTADDINKTYKNLVEALASHDPKVKLSIANSIFYNQDFSVKSDFISTNQDYYNAEVDALDFSNANATLDRVNGWVKSNTHNKIQKIIDQVSPYDVMYLINAIYFKGDWTYQFEKDKTQDRTFFAENGNELQVPSMTFGETTLRYTATDVCQIIELPYGDKKYSMLILLPIGSYTANDVIENLSSAALQSWVDNLQETKQVVYLPKFEFSYENSLNDNLQALGMIDAFDPSKSDFSGISDQQDLYISEVKHKSYIKVDEEGTEAAAVTGITFGVTSVQPQPVFNINRPFVFAIREADTNAILFIGKINNPLSDE